MKRIQLTTNFFLDEFENSETARANRYNNAVPSCLIPSITNLCEQLLQPLRNLYGKSITISSGYRCTQLNDAVGGVPSSQHRLGEASDCKCADPKELLRVLRASKLPYDLAILYPTFLHLSLKKTGNNRRQVIVK